MTTPRIELELNEQNIDDHIGIEAGEWVARLTDAPVQAGDMSAGEPDEAFFQWMSRSSQHREIFVDTFAMYCRLENIDAQRRIDVAALVAQTADDSAPARKPLTDVSISRRRYRNHWASAAAAALAILLIAGGYWGLEFWGGIAPQPQIYSTAVGERRHLTLSDGSMVILNTASRIEVQFTRADRQIRLVKGEIFVDVRHDTHWPFSVVIDGVRIIDTGTQFDVYKRSSEIKVSVLKGSVRVSCTCSLGADLSRGEQAEIVANGRAAKLQRNLSSETELQRELAWREGALYLKGAPLSEAVEEFNRYNTVQFVIADPSIASNRIGGYFPSPNPDELMKTLQLQGVIDSEVDPATPNRIRLIRRRPHPEERSGSRPVPDIATPTKRRRADTSGSGHAPGFSDRCTATGNLPC